VKKFFVLLLPFYLLSCVTKDTPEDLLTVTQNFNTTWNIYESIVQNDDGSITYNAVPWGGLVGTFMKHNMPVDWSSYESIRFDFSEPTTSATQIYVSEGLQTWGKAGISTLSCHFDGQNVKNISEVVLQSADSSSITITRVSLIPNEATWDASTIWMGHCVFEKWMNGFVIPASKFADANEGDKLELIFSTDRSVSDVTYWLMKTIYSGTTQTLEGNDNEINEHGCLRVGKEATVYRIELTANDVENLKEKGLFVNGYYVIVTQCNLLHRKS
jgi:hypothetical protein